MCLTTDSSWNFPEKVKCWKCSVFHSSNKEGKRYLMQVESLPLTLEIFIK